MFSYFLQRFNILHAMIISLPAEYSPKKSTFPRIGYALDGYLIYGRYTAAGQPGIDVDLDLCGGHSHDAFGYHYHPSVTRKFGCLWVGGGGLSGVNYISELFIIIYPSWN